MNELNKEWNRLTAEKSGDISPLEVIISSSDILSDDTILVIIKESQRVVFIDDISVEIDGNIPSVVLDFIISINTRGGNRSTTIAYYLYIIASRR